MLTESAISYRRELSGNVSFILSCFVLALALSPFAKSQNKSTSQVIKLITWFKEIVFASKFE